MGMVGGGEAHQIPSDEAHKPVNIFLFLRQLGKLTELGLNNKTDVQIFGKVPIRLQMSDRRPNASRRELFGPGTDFG